MAQNSNSNQIFTNSKGTWTNAPVIGHVTNHHLFDQGHCLLCGKFYKEVVGGDCFNIVQQNFNSAENLIHNLRGNFKDRQKFYYVFLIIF